MILAVATIVVIAMLIMATPFLFKMSMQARTTEKSNRSLSAFNLAEAGIDRALWEMNQPYGVTGGIVAVDETGNGTIVPTNEVVGDRTGTIQGTITTNLAVEPNVRTIVATGGIPHIAGQPVTRTVSVNLEKYFKSIWDYGIFADEGIWTKTNFRTFSFNSNYGAYGATKPGGGLNKGMDGHAGTNATGDQSIEIQQGSSSYIHGNLASGVGTEPADLQDVIYADQPDSSLFPDDVDGTSGDAEDHVRPVRDALRRPVEPAAPRHVQHDHRLPQLVHRTAVHRSPPGIEHHRLGVQQGQPLRVRDGPDPVRQRRLYELHHP